MRPNVLIKAATTLLVLSYPFFTHWLLPRWQAAPAFALMLPPAALNALMAWVFGRTLAAGREPMISLFARMEHEALVVQPGADLPHELQGYTRALTKIWTALFAFMAAVAIVLAWSGLHAWWALFTGVLSYLMMGILFFGEYMFRRLRFAQYPHAHPLQLVWTLIKAGPSWMRSR